MWSLSQNKMDDLITKIDKLNKTKRLIYINDEPAFALYFSDIKKCGLKEGVVFDPVLSEKVHDILFERGLKRALYLIRSKEHTANELKKKLTASYYPSETADSVIDKLKEERLVDDIRYTRMYIEVFLEKKPAAIIKSDLKKKGIDTDTINEIYDEVIGDTPDTELYQCIRLLEKKYPIDKYRDILDSDNEKDKYTLKNKAMAFLARKGFSFDAVSESLKEYFDI